MLHCFSSIWLQIQSKLSALIFYEGKFTFWYEMQLPEVICVMFRIQSLTKFLEHYWLLLTECRKDENKEKRPIMIHFLMRYFGHVSLDDHVVKTKIAIFIFEAILKDANFWTVKLFPVNARRPFVWLTRKKWKKFGRKKFQIFSMCGVQPRQGQRSGLKLNYSNVLRLPPCLPIIIIIVSVSVGGGGGCVALNKTAVGSTHIIRWHWNIHRICVVVGVILWGMFVFSTVFF